MKVSRFLPLLALAWAQACAIYNEGLLEGGDDDTVEASGGKSSGSGGKPSGKGGTPASGGRSSGGAPSGGAQANGGANTGGEESDETGGRSAGSGGESESGGAPNGGTSSGGASSGGAGTGGTPSGGAGTGGESTGSGGTAPTGPFLITDMQTAVNYANPPFAGAWTRYGQDDVEWVVEDDEDMVDMFVLRGGSASDLVLRVAAEFPTNEWGADMAITLKGGNAIDLSPYKTLIFDAMRASGTYSTLRVALEDEASHQGSTLCTSAGVGADCNKHVEALLALSLNSTWRTFTFDLDTTSFADCGPSCTRSTPLDLTKVYAIHFKMDPSSSTPIVDFSIDNIIVDN